VTTLTRSIIASRVAEETGIRRSDVDLVSRRMLALIGAALGRGETVKLSGFATFGLRFRAERPGRNPHTGEMYPIKARRVVHLVPGGRLQQEFANRAAVDT